MNDRYLFRGKRIDNGEWLIGHYVTVGHHDNDTHRHCCIMPMEECVDCEIAGQRIYEIDPETIGQCTGLKDENGTLIFEGDVVRGRNEYEISIVVCRDGVWMMSQFVGHNPALWGIDPIEIIGNIWDNPELLE